MKPASAGVLVANAIILLGSIWIMADAFPGLPHPFVLVLMIGVLYYSVWSVLGVYNSEVNLSHDS